jgi:hypothetical protein
MPSRKRSDVEPAEDASGAATGATDVSDGTPGDVGSWPGDQQKAWDVTAPDLFDAPPPPGPDVAAPIYVHVEDAPARNEAIAEAAKPKRRARKAKPAPPATRTYRARQTVMGPAGRVRPGEYVVLPSDSGLARSPFLVAVEDADVPAAVAAALAAAEDDAG